MKESADQSSNERSMVARAGEITVILKSSVDSFERCMLSNLRVDARCCDLT